MNPIPHDGWRSRRLILGGAVFLVLEGIATLALVAGWASFDQWSGFNEIIVPSVLVPLLGALHLDKREQAKVVVAQLAQPEAP